MNKGLSEKNMNKLIKFSFFDYRVSKNRTEDIQNSFMMDDQCIMLLVGYDEGCWNLNILRHLNDPRLCEY